MAKHKKQKVESTLPVPDLGTNVDAPTPIVKQWGTQCDSCHAVFGMIYYHPSAPFVPLCADCYKFVNRRATRSLQTPTNPERI